MKTLQINSCFGAKNPNIFQIVDNFDESTMIAIFDGNGVDGYSVHVSVEDLLRLREYVNERVRDLIFKGVLSDRLAD